MANLNSSGSTGYGTAPARQRAENLPQERHNAFTNAPMAPKHTGYGLPCAECKTYYAADLPACPICKSPERVSPTAIPVPAAVQSADPTPDSDQLEAERERFLLQLKSQAYAAHTQINAAASFRCSVEP